MVPPDERSILEVVLSGYSVTDRRTLRDLLADSLGAEYELGRELGGGGMARVFLARDRTLDRDIVVKVLHPDLAQGISAERFTREIRVTARLQAPHIVPILSTGQTASGLPYYTMPFVRGESLGTRLARGGALPLREARDLLRDIARALSAAHLAGIVHRDIKPGNVLLAANGAMVADFGIAKAMDVSQRERGAVTLTWHGMALGTPAYMAPEQAVGDPTADHRVDLYAWGIVAYELLTGRHPFAMHTTAHALLAAHLSEAPRPMMEHFPDVPRALSELVMRCLAKAPADRPRSATDLISALEVGLPEDVRAPRPVIERGFRLDDAVCRRIDREALDARMIGGTVRYLENDAPSDVLLVCLPGMGLEGAGFTELLELLPHRSIAPTLFGFDPVAAGERVPLPLPSHFAILRELLRDAEARLEPEHVVLLSFSSGADVALRLLADAPEDLPRVDGCVAFAPNLSLDTCFASRVLARLHGGAEAELIEDLHRIGAAATTLDEWLNVTTYLLHVLRKFRGDVGALSRHASDIVSPFEIGGDPFPAWFRGAAKRVRVLTCIFESSDLHLRLVRDLRLRNLDAGLLGPHYTEDSLVLEDTRDHFRLLEPDRILRHVERVVRRLRDGAGSVRPKE